MESKPHVVVIPLPAQGHVMPLMKLSYCLVDQGFRVTFVNTEALHTKLMDSLKDKGNDLGNIRMVAIPDGLTPEERKDVANLLFTVLVTEFDNLIRKMMESEKIACVIVDEGIGWASEVAMKLGIRVASFLPTCAGFKALSSNIPKLIEMGVIDEDGTIKKNGTILLSPTLPPMKPTRFPWNKVHTDWRNKFFQYMLKNHRISQSAEWVLCNSSDKLEHAALSLLPNLIPIGPLLADNQLGNLWPEDSACINWLNQQPTSSVIYIAFGSLVIHDDQRQFEELALGLELLGHPFLWVVREDSTGGLTTTFPEGFQDRVAHFGKIVAWAPQQAVLAHPSIASFISHCGWNSTMDGVINGVPFISWPYYSDQFLNQTYITDVWKVGLGVNPDDEGIVTAGEIKRKVDQLLGDEEIRANALKLKEMVMTSVGKGGSSTKSFEQFVQEVKS